MIRTWKELFYKWIQIIIYMYSRTRNSKTQKWVWNWINTPLKVSPWHPKLSSKWRFRTWKPSLFPCESLWCVCMYLHIIFKKNIYIPRPSVWASNFSPNVCFWWVFEGSNFRPLEDSGIIILPTQTMHYFSGKSLKVTIDLNCFIPQKMGNLLTGRLTAGTYSHHPWKERKSWSEPNLHGVVFQPLPSLKHSHSTWK